jgi:lipopolysaccharide biosynthesis glycosyltransferase
MDVVSAFDEKFVIPTTVMLSSAMSTAAEPLNFHLLVPRGFMSSSSKDIISELFSRYPINCFKFYEIDSKIFEDAGISMNGLAHFADAALFRIVMDRVLPLQIDFILYLDADVLVCKWDELTRIYRTNPIFAARLESLEGKFGNHDYFNSGVFVTSLSYWRKRDLSRLMIEFLQINPNSVLKDQDALNFVFRDVNQRLPVKTNCPPTSFGFTQDVEIIHYVGTRKPWKKHAPLTKTTRLWRKQYKSLYMKNLILEKVDHWLLKFIINSIIASMLNFKVILKRLSG